VAAGLYHFVDRARPAPAARVLARGRRRLARLGPRCCGLELGALLPAVEAWERWLAAPVGAPPPLPRLVLVAPDEP
jgi:hypothetical protein